MIRHVIDKNKRRRAGLASGASLRRKTQWGEGLSSTLRILLGDATPRSGRLRSRNRSAVLRKTRLPIRLVSVLGRRTGMRSRKSSDCFKERPWRGSHAVTILTTVRSCKEPSHGNEPELPREVSYGKQPPESCKKQSVPMGSHGSMNDRIAHLTKASLRPNSDRRTYILAQRGRFGLATLDTCLTYRVSKRSI